MKFDVKNCPSYDKGIDECRSEYTEHICCWMNEFCPIKQIVIWCKIYRNMNATTTEDYSRREVALKILNLLEVEEVDEQ